MRTGNLLVVGLLAALLAGCAGAPAARESTLDVDAMIRVVAESVVRELSGGPERTVVVSYFTEDGEISGISDYLIGDLTTTLANAGKGTLRVVSRQVLDRLLEEISFQTTDLADEESQIQVGRQLGADLILTGFILRLGEGGQYRLNTQLVEVETGVVVTGVIQDFLARADLAARLEPETSETVLLSRESVEVAGTGTLTTLFEDFDHGPPQIQLERYVDTWGDRVLSSGGSVDLVSEGSADGSAYVRFSHRATVDNKDLLGAWGDSGLRFVSRIQPGEPIEGYDGISFSLRAEGFTTAALFLKQSTPDRETWFYLALPVDTGLWRDYKIPFAVFEASDSGDRLDPSQPLVIDISVAFDENWYSYYFREGNDITAALSLDNVGYYRRKAPDDTRVVETFDDEIDRMPWTAYHYGVSIYTDYTTDEGVTKLNPGVDGQTLRLVEREPGASGSGRYLSLESTMALTGRIGQFFDEGQGITLFMSSPLAVDPTGFTGLSFYIRSDLLTHGRLELWDQAHERAYVHELRVTGFWTRVRVPFAAWAGEQGSLRDALAAGLVPARARMQLAFDLPGDPLVQSGSGDFSYNLALDDFVWER